MHPTISAILLIPSLSTYTDLPHLLFLNQSFSCFFQLISFISSSVGAAYVFYPLHVSSPSSKHLPQVVSKHDHTTSHHLSLPIYLLLFQSQHVHQLLCIPCPQLYTAHPLTIDHFALLKIRKAFRK